MMQKTQNSKLNIPVVSKRALIWWNKLTKSQKQNYEFKIYGYGDHMEDNTLRKEDIIQIYKSIFIFCI